MSMNRIQMKGRTKVRCYGLWEVRLRSRKAGYVRLRARKEGPGILLRLLYAGLQIWLQMCRKSTRDGGARGADGGAYDVPTEDVARVLGPLAHWRLRECARGNGRDQVGRGGMDSGHSRLFPVYTRVISVDFQGRKQEMRREQDDGALDSEVQVFRVKFELDDRGFEPKAKSRFSLILTSNAAFYKDG
jgi:hypothetical protein